MTAATPSQRQSRTISTPSSPGHRAPFDRIHRLNLQARRGNGPAVIPIEWKHSTPLVPRM
jgi:hypothetical protein